MLYMSGFLLRFIHVLLIPGLSYPRYLLLSEHQTLFVRTGVEIYDSNFVLQNPEDVLCIHCYRVSFNGE